MKLIVTIFLTAMLAASQTVKLDTFPMSSAVTPDGRFLLVLHSGTEKPSVQVLDAKTLEKRGRAELTDAWLGIAISPNGKNVYVSGGATGNVFELSLNDQGGLQPARTFETVPAPQRQPQDLIGDVQLSPDGRLLYAAALYRNRIFVINPASGLVIERIPTTRRPYRILFHPDGKSFFVSGWADSAVIHHQAETGEKLGVIRTGPHPTDMAWQTKTPKLEEGESIDWKLRLFVAASNTNSVYAFGFKEDKTAIPLGTISVALTPQQPAGMTPSALALTTNQNILYTACSDADLVAVTDISGVTPLRLGYVPSGKYPVAVRSFSDDRLLILNGDDNSASAAVPDLIPLDIARENSPYRDEQLFLPDQKSALQHVVYVIDEGTANGPNVTQLSSEFVQFPRFRANGNQLIDQTDWAGAAITTDFIRKLSPGISAGRRKPVADTTPASVPPAGRLWDNAKSKGLPVLAVNDVKSVSAESLPQLTVLHLRDQDRELGALIEKLSRSSAWKSTVVFVVKPATQTALVISPYTKKSAKDETDYDTSSILRTIELIIGLQPMTQFDAAATPMSGAFGSVADTTPYTAVQ